MGDPDYRKLPRVVRHDETVTSAATGCPPDADDLRNVDQHAALRDD